LPEVSSTRCPVCGSDSVIYDSEYSEIVCSRCGLVLDDKPVDNRLGNSITFYFGSAIMNKKTGFYRVHMETLYLSNRIKQMNPHTQLRYEKLLFKTCSGLLLSRDTCIEALKVFRMLISESKYVFLHEKRARTFIALAIYSVAKSRGIPISISSVEEATGVSGLISDIWEYVDVLGLKHNYELELDKEFSRVAVAVSKIIPDRDLLQKIIATAREALKKIRGGRYVYRAIAAFYYAVKKHGVTSPPWNMTQLCRELGLNVKCHEVVWKLANKYLKVKHGSLLEGL